VKKRPKNVWQYDAEALALNYFNDDGNFYVGIDLERCRTAAEVLDYIAQAAKTLVLPDAVVGSLVRALDRVFDLQGNLCGCGEDYDPLDVKTLLEGTTSHDFPVGGPGMRVTEQGNESFHARTATQALNDPLPDPIRPRAEPRQASRRDAPACR